MKFLCEQQELLKAINTVSKAITTRTTIPILKGILLKLENEDLILSASDLEISIEKKIKVKGQVNGSIVVSAKLFADIIRKMPPGNLTISLNEKDQLKIETSFSEFNIGGQDSDDFPNIALLENMDNKFSIDKNLFKDMIRKTAFCASLEESKGIIVGVLIEREKESLNMVSLDGFRMAVLRNTVNNEKEEMIIIPAKVLLEIGKILSEEDREEEVEIVIDSKRVLIIINETKVVARLLEGDFIKYKDILPKEKKTKILINKYLLQDSIERASLLSREGKNNLVKFSIDEEKLTITSRSEEGNVKEEIGIEKIGDNLEIGFNHKYILDVLKAVDEEELVFEFNTPTSPCIIKKTDGKYFEYLILPVRINN